jgi:predicted PhzF superfamily epimerase YddE/YHI9
MAAEVQRADGARQSLELIASPAGDVGAAASPASLESQLALIHGGALSLLRVGFARTADGDAVAVIRSGDALLELQHEAARRLFSKKLLEKAERMQNWDKKRGRPFFPTALFNEVPAAASAASARS